MGAQIIRLLGAGYKQSPTEPGKVRESTAAGEPGQLFSGGGLPTGRREEARAVSALTGFTGGTERQALTRQLPGAVDYLGGMSDVVSEHLSPGLALLGSGVRATSA